MKVTIPRLTTVDIKKLKVEAHARYWEDFEVNGVSDDDGKDVPCRVGDMWCPIIDFDSGKVMNWEQGKTADVHIKVCDRGSYYLLDENDEVILSIEENYVPKIMCPKDSGYGDYIIMDIDENGMIKDWVMDLSGFIDED